MNKKPAARDCSHPRYPEYREEFGEDPARFLYHLPPRPRIRGIDDPGLLRAYLNVEAERASPRQEIISACNARLIDLEERGNDAQQQAVVSPGGV